MKELYDLKEMLCKELKSYGARNDLSAGSLDIVDKLAHTIKNLDRIIEKYEMDNGSYASYNDSMDGSYRSYRGSYDNGYSRDSYARGRGAKRDTMGRYSKDAYDRGRYSRDNGLSVELQEMMQDAPNDQIRQEMQKLIDKLESM